MNTSYTSELTWQKVFDNVRRPSSDPVSEPASDDQGARACCPASAVPSDPRPAAIPYPDASFDALFHDGHEVLDSAMLYSLSSPEWITWHHNLLVTGSVGVGKTYFVSALASLAARQGSNVLWKRMDSMLGQSSQILQPGSESGTPDMLVIDDFAMRPFDLTESRALYELTDRFNDTVSFVVISPVPVFQWQYMFAAAPYGIAVQDRLLDQASMIDMPGRSRRRPLTYEEAFGCPF